MLYDARMNQISKEEVAELPIGRYEGDVRLVTGPA